MTMHKKALEHKRWLRREKKKERNEDKENEETNFGMSVDRRVRGIASGGLQQLIFGRK